ncbi:unknown [Diachasmimorpha longicaudata entomopoxvirus]|uniref:Uncharacterized protein n=1 Tax=Diachasmimorpha longicaudata entomopoxvirus TaxID=109981 RepID=Q8B5Y4_9POXV|nr:hypothetical protein FLA14_p204 [Diachasmimorpha longicaudata entomopoxvirus]AAN88021.1 unknown [Diachasmimorpha longicaudata entomopoxvirus]
MVQNIIHYTLLVLLIKRYFSKMCNLLKNFQENSFLLDYIYGFHHRSHKSSLHSKIYKILLILYVWTENIRYHVIPYFLDNF